MHKIMVLHNLKYSKSWYKFHCIKTASLLKKIIQWTDGIQRQKKTFINAIDVIFLLSVNTLL